MAKFEIKKFIQRSFSKRVAAVFIIPSFLLIAFCSYSSVQKDDRCQLLEIDTDNIKSSMLVKIREVIDKDSIHNSFFLYPTLLYKKEGSNEVRAKDDIKNEIFLLCPASQSLIGDGEFSLSHNYPSQYFKVDNKIIFLSSPTDALFNQFKLKSEYVNIVKDKSYSNGQKLFLIVWKDKDYTQIISEREFMLDSDIVNIQEQHRHVVDFIPPSLKR